MSKKSKGTAALKSAVGSSNAKSDKHITKISASRPKTTEQGTNQKSSNATSPAKLEKASGAKPSNTKNPNKHGKKPKTAKAKIAEQRTEKPLKEVFILARPFVRLGRYLRDSWRELRGVRWPNRKATWKMTLAVILYCAVFMVFILLLDTFFTWLFNLLLTK